MFERFSIFGYILRSAKGTAIEKPLNKENEYETSIVYVYASVQQIFSTFSKRKNK